MAPTPSHHRLVRLATAYDADVPDGPDEITFTLPEDLSTVDTERLDGLLEEARDAFDAIYGDGDGDYAAEDVEAMNRLGDAADAIREELGRREAEAEENRQAAAQAAARFAADETDDTADEEAEPVEGETVDVEAVDAPEEHVEGDPEPVEPVEAPEAVAASGGPIEVTLRGVRNRQRRTEPRDEGPGGLSLLASADLRGVAAGTRISLDEAADRFLDRSTALVASHGRTVVGIGSVRKDFPSDLILGEEDDAAAVMARAADESRLPGGSLVASAGWCSPSETIYELAEATESRDGLVSFPEIGVSRGGIRHTLGPDFSSIFSEADLSFAFTEYDVETGNYDGYGGGTKPCFFVPCPEFHEDRLDVAGVCIQAGLLQSRAYPETIRRYVSGALVAHEFKQAGRKLERVEAGSTEVNLPAGQVGTAAPVLTAIELQVEDYRQRHRLSDGRTLEAVFPRWVRGAIRSDLSRRLGVELLDVSNAQIGTWFANRGVNAQFVYELDDLTGDAADRTSWPTSVKFLLYLSGTWVAATQGIIEVEGVFDHALIERNIFTELFTEEGWLIAKRFHDSRVVTVPICTDGATHGGVDIACNGTEVTENG